MFGFGIVHVAHGEKERNVEKPNSSTKPPPQPLTPEEKANRLNYIVLAARAQARQRVRARAEMRQAKRAMVGR